MLYCTSCRPAIREGFTVQSQGAVFAKIAECNHVLASKIFGKADVLVTCSLGMEAYDAKGLVKVHTGPPG